VVIVGRSAAAYAALRGSFARHEVEKEYVALVLGCVAAAGDVTSALRGRGRARVAREKDDGLSAETRFSPIEVFASGLTLVRIETSTGRRHQVRVHLASLGHPLAGDATYQSAKERAYDRTGLKEPFLHASRIVVPHPVTGARVDVSAELPADRQAVLSRLRGAV
jgi:23S rRNA-/tRNA-specific pseudouridylate synthase